MTSTQRPAVVYTVGHSTRPIDAFIALLNSHAVKALADVRTVPKSRHNPQFGREALAASLADAGIAYRPFPGLGGFRRPRPDSPNTGWRNTSFRGYADYMQTDEFRGHLDALVDLARAQTLAVMCAEAVPWRCHRSLIADALTVRGIPVAEIAGETRTQPHRLTPFARVDGPVLTYPGLVGD
ncbi:MAG TPA: DUF488 domain-containing protein [Casimicrobiaceae bacterium]|nr:DUF488 domain-containing protein [Casimicrobiaceae bacterium]